MCSKPDCIGLKIRSQQQTSGYTLEAQAEYDAAINMHFAAIGQRQRAVKKNKEIKKKTKLYR